MASDTKLRPSETFAHYFLLKEQDRKTFKLNPATDSAHYVDLDASLGKLKLAIEGGKIPQVVVEGDFGTGKTHVLHVAETMARDAGGRKKYTTLFLELSGFKSNTDFISGIHRPLIEKLLEKILADPKVYEMLLNEHTMLKGMGSAVEQAFRGLLNTNRDVAVAARAWLCASRTLTPSKALKAGYSSLLDESLGPAQLAALYIAIARAWYAATEHVMLLFLDEGESFTRVTNEDAQASIGAGLRQLFDSSNEHFGLFLGLNTPRTRKGTHPMLRSDVRSRLTVIPLQTLQDESLRRRFLDGLWQQLAADPSTTLPFLLDSAAQRFVIQEIDEIRRRVLKDMQHVSPTQRDMLSILDLIAQSAFVEKEKFPLREEVVRRWLGLPRLMAHTGLRTMLRYLHAPSAAHFRLGWLDVLVRLVGTGPRSLAEVAEDLGRLRDESGAWLDKAGITAPRGELMPSSVSVHVRMLVSFDCYDEKRHALNDAGNVLLAIRESQKSPFEWSGERRWIGLWLLMRANGDVVLSILRDWPDTDIVDKALDDFVAERLKQIAESTSDDQERSALLSQADRISATHGRRAVVYPHLEPLRDLGYLYRVSGCHQYKLTPAGERLRTVLMTTFSKKDASSILREGLSRCFFAGEGVDDARPADFSALVEGIQHAPENLLVSANEAPLSPLVAWVQGKLLERGTHYWIDDAMALKLARQTRSDSLGRFDLKRDEHIDGVNLSWSPVHHHVEQEDVVSVNAEMASESPIESISVDQSSARRDWLEWSGSHIRALLWLQYVHSRTEELCFEDADVLRCCGVSARFRQLGALMDMPRVHFDNKRKVPPDKLPCTSVPSLACLSRFDSTVGGRFHLPGLLAEWKKDDVVDIDRLRSRLALCADESKRVAGADKQTLVSFIRAKNTVPLPPSEVTQIFEKEWPRVRELTRAWIADFIADGTWDKSSLRSRVTFHVAQEKSVMEAALCLLEDPASMQRRYAFRRNLVCRDEWVDRANGTGLLASYEHTISLRPIDAIDGSNASLSVEGIRASTLTHANRIGAVLCDELIAQISWRLRAPIPTRSPKDSCEPEDTCDEDAPIEASEDFPLDWHGLTQSRQTAREGVARIDPLEDARQSLARLTSLERRESERLLVAWTIVEDLAKAGRDLPSHEVIANLSRVIAVGLFRRRLLAVYDHSVAALIALTHLDISQDTVGKLISFWLPAWREASTTVIQQSDVARRASLYAAVQRQPPESEQAVLEKLWTGSTRQDGTPARCECEALQIAITTHAPLAARYLADVWNALDIGPAGTLQSGKKIANMLVAYLDDARSFLAEVYDARNRMVHQGELGRLHGRGAPVQLQAIVPLLLDVVELVTDELHRTGANEMRSAWAHFANRVADLTEPTRLVGLTSQDFFRLIGLFLENVLLAKR